MINVYIISGFLGAGKTTFIQKLLKEKKFEKVMLLENEFGEVGVDGAFFDSSLNIKEINNGCICCNLQGDFDKALEEIEEMDITDLIIEPSGVGKLSEIINVILNDDDFRIVSHICIVDVKTCQKYHKNFKEYFDDQVIAANAIVLSHIDVALKEEIDDAIKMIRTINDDAKITDKSLDQYNIEELLDIIIDGEEICLECLEEHHHDHHHDCSCHKHEHEHHDHEHDHDHHHDDEIFKNLILRPSYIFEKEELENILSNLDEDIIRAKGYVYTKEGTLYFNYILNEYHTYYGKEKDNSLISLIGTSLNDNLKELFHA